MRKFGIPTKHKGRQFRSRLEARWARFFDLLGWQFEYEPFDLRGWIPDFLLIADRPILVEIKPVISFPQKIGDKLLRSDAPEDFDLLILGCTIPVQSLSEKRSIFPLSAGWHMYGQGQILHGYWCDAFFGLWTNGNGQIGLCNGASAWQDLIHPGPPGEPHGDSFLSPLRVSELWTAAGNKTQWMPPR